MESVTVLTQTEAAWVDRERLAGLYAQLGREQSEQVVCRAIEELAVRLTHAENLFRLGHRDELLASGRGIIAISDQIGLTGLGLVAGHMVTCLRQHDDIALAAVLARLLRVGELSLNAVWEMQDFSA